MLTLRQGDALAIAKTYPPDHFDAALLDPPYGLEFMGQSWDKVLPPAEFWLELFRTMKPGAFAFVYGGARTFHRLAVALEDAGFELIDVLMWLYGNGYPKGAAASNAPRNKRRGGAKLESITNQAMLALPLSERLEHWKAERQLDGYNSQLKPAYEPIALIRKPPVGSNYDTFRATGAGLLHIDAARIDAPPSRFDNWRPNSQDNPTTRTGIILPGLHKTNKGGKKHEGGRYPANIMFDGAAAIQLDEAVGVTKSTQRIGARSGKTSARLGAFKGQKNVTMGHSDEGGPSRFFYTGKASAAERDAGLAKGENDHPTVKPIAISSYLARLLLVPNRGRMRYVWNPYSGSGTEAIALMLAGWEVIDGFDQSAHFIDIAERRFAFWQGLKDADEQATRQGGIFQ